MHTDTIRIAARTTFYGVPVHSLGDEGGELIALGHPGTRRALAAWNKYLRTEFGLDGLGDPDMFSHFTYQQILEYVTEGYAQRIVRCAYCDFAEVVANDAEAMRAVARARGPRCAKAPTGRHALMGDPDYVDWYIRTDANETDSHAFPVTILNP